MRRLHATIALAIAISVTSLTACKPPAPLILVVGDSITWQATNEIVARGEKRGYRVMVRAVGGTTTQDWHKTTGNLIRDFEPDVVIVALGTNNSIDPSFPGFARLADQDPFDVQVAKMLRITSKAPCSTWVEPTENPHRSSTAAATQANVALLREAVPASHRIAWNAKQSQEPRPGAWIQPDGIHLTSTGDAVFARFVIDLTINKCGI